MIVAMLCAIGWLVCSVVAYRMLRSTWLEEADWTRRDRADALTIAVMGPVAVLLALAERRPRRGGEVLIPRRRGDK